MRANRNPKAMPPAAPKTKASTVSCRVIQRWPQISGFVISIQVRFRTSTGVEKKNWICLGAPRIG